MDAIAAKRVNLVQEVVDNEPQMSAEQRRNVLKKENRRMTENDVSERSVE